VFIKEVKKMTGRNYPLNWAIIWKNKKIIFFLTILLSFAGIAHAEQTKTIKYLANEPLTLLDLGIYRLNRLVNEEPYGSAKVAYDWENNKINIHITILEHIANVRGNVKNTNEAYVFTNHLINLLRTKLGVNYQTGEIKSGYTLLENCFRPVHGGKKRNEPESLKEDLFDMVNISVTFSGKNVTLRGKTALKGIGINLAESRK
jgi:hypothetical protein